MKIGVAAALSHAFQVRNAVREKVPYGWVVVGAGMTITCIAMGSAFSLAVFLTPISEATGWSRTGVSTAGTLVFLAMAVSSFGWGILSDRHGARAVVMAGGALLAVGLAAASQTESLLGFQLVFGILIGAAGGSFYAPLMAVATAWFERHRSLAVALISAGTGMAPLTVAPFARALISAYDWRTAMLIVGCVAAAIVLPVAFLIAKPPTIIPAQGISKQDFPNQGMSAKARRRRRRARPLLVETPMTTAQAFRSSAFVAIALTHFACCAAHSGPIFHMVAYAMGCGIAPMAAVSVYGVAGLSGLGGRILCGLAADKYGVKQVLVIGLVVQALAAGTYIFVSRLGEFYALAVVFALAYGGVMPLYAILVRDYFGLRIMGTVFGAVSAVASLGMALGPLFGGWAFDTFGGYGWLYIGSFGIGLGAVAVALTFKPMPKPPANAMMAQPA